MAARHGERYARGTGDRWLLLDGAPLTPEVWDGVAGDLTPYGPVTCPDITLTGEDRDVSTALAGRVHVVGHSFGRQVALDLALLAPQRVATLTLVCSRGDRPQLRGRRHLHTASTRSATAGHSAGVCYRLVAPGSGSEISLTDVSPRLRGRPGTVVARGITADG
jgi:pimeloyl-ACP methyl ester carboxylesterase